MPSAATLRLRLYFRSQSGPRLRETLPDLRHTTRGLMADTPRHATLCRMLAVARAELLRRDAADRRAWAGLYRGALEWACRHRRAGRSGDVPRALARAEHHRGLLTGRVVTRPPARPWSELATEG